jgi:hypothetical protein
MARSFGKVRSTIWDDPDFRALSPGAQRLYVQILSQKRLTLAGVVPFSPRAWARGCDDLEAADIETAAAELADAGFVIIDYDTEELMVRTMLKHDPVKGARTVAGMWNAWSEIDSTEIRQRVIHSLPVEIWDTKDVEVPAAAKTIANTGREGVSEGVYEGVSDGVCNRSFSIENRSETNENEKGAAYVDGLCRWPIENLSQSTDLRKTHPEHVDAIEQAFFEACYPDAANAGIDRRTALTGREVGKVQAAATDVLRLGATPDEVHIRVNRARGRWSDPGMVTPKGVAANWATFAVDTPVEPTRPTSLQCSEHHAPIIDGECAACRVIAAEAS